MSTNIQEEIDSASHNIKPLHDLANTTIFSFIFHCLCNRIV